MWKRSIRRQDEDRPGRHFLSMAEVTVSWSTEAPLVSAQVKTTHGIRDLENLYLL